MRIVRWYNGPDCVDGIWHVISNDGTCKNCDVKGNNFIRRVRGQPVLMHSGKQTTYLAVALAIKQNNKCCWCKREFSELLLPTIEHLIPLSLGGKSIYKNVRAACSYCNTMRGNMPIKTWVAYMKSHDPWRKGNWEDFPKSWKIQDGRSHVSKILRSYMEGR